MKKQYSVGIDMQGVTEVDHLGRAPYDGEVFVIGEETDADRYAGDYYDEPPLIDATDEEQRAWKDAYAVLTTQMTSVESDLLKAREAWVAAKETAEQARKAAWSLYAPVQTAIESRRDEITEERRLELERRENAAEAEELRRRAEEDAVHGAREFLVTRPRLRDQESREMDVPTIHLVGCVSTQRMKRLPEPVRIEEAFTALMDGGVPYRKQWGWEPVNGATEARLFGEVCTRCGVEEKFLAEYPETYLDWRARAESIQPPLPRDSWNATTKFFITLGLPRATGRMEGYTRISSEEQELRHKKVITANEGLLCWVDGKYRQPDKEKLDALITALYENGMIGRYLSDDDSVVVFRKMTKGELRAKAEKVTA